jgi:hypothetical protein
MTIDESGPDALLPRRALLARLAGGALSLLGLTAFRRPGAPKWDDRYELAIDLEIPAQMSPRFPRPYVAVWIEDATGRRVRNLSLWVNTRLRGPRYIRELHKWFAAVRDAEDSDMPPIVATVSSATRQPGSYTVVWNGRDDEGKPVDQGSYRVCIEAAREHGDYGFITQEIALGTDPVAMQLGRNEEITRARVDYRLRQ